MNKFSATIRTRLVPFLTLLIVASAASAATPRILVVGDSWTLLMIGNLQTALDNVGLSEFEVHGDLTAIGGTRASQWATPYFLDLITQELTAFPSIDIVHLSMGGNDVLAASWSTPTEFQALAETIFDNIDVVVAHILSIRPNAKIAWCSYDYVQDVSLNDELGMLTQEAIDRAALNPRFFCINNLGLMHVTYGYPGEFGPGERPLPGGYPDYTPLMGGDPAFPGPPEAFLDAIHLTYEGYGVLAERCVSEFYVFWLTPQPGTPLVSWPLVPILAAIGVYAGRRLRRSA